MDTARLLAERDVGLGLCYQGVKVNAERDLARQKPGAKNVLPGFIPNYAVTLAPYPFGHAVLALPVCYGCLTGSKDSCGGIVQAAGSGLIVPNGRMSL